MFHFYKAALVDYFMDLAIFVDSVIIVMKQHNLLITVVRPFLLNGSFNFLIVSSPVIIEFFSFIQSVRFLPYPKTPIPSAFLRNCAFLPFLAVKIAFRPTPSILVLSVDPSDTPTFHHLL
jgi:hypothetical protein